MPTPTVEGLVGGPVPCVKPLVSIVALAFFLSKSKIFFHIQQHDRPYDPPARTNIATSQLHLDFTPLPPFAPYLCPTTGRSMALAIGTQLLLSVSEWQVALDRPTSYTLAARLF